MSNWKGYQLKDIGLIKTGKTPPSSCQNAFSDYGIPFVTPKDMTGVKTIFKTERYLSDNGLNTVKNYLVPKNSIAVSCIGSDMGKAYLLSRDSVTNQQINTLIVNNKHNFEFIYYKLSTLQDYLKSIAGGSATPILNKSHFSELEIELPDLETQNYIVEKLKFLDQKIQLNTQINQTLEQIAQAIFKSWFVDFDPVRAKADALESGKTEAEAELAAMQAISGKTAAELTALRQSAPEKYRELAEIAEAFPSAFEENGLPRGWEISTIGDCYDVIMGQSPKGETYNENREGMLFYQGRAEFGWRFPSPRLFTTDPKRIAEKNSILMSVRAPVGDINVAFEKCCIGRGLAALQHKSRSLSFGLYQIKAVKAKLDLFNGEGTVFGSINQANLKNISIIKPNDKVIELFEQNISYFDKKIRNNESEIITLKETRDLLLPKLLNGDL